MTLGKGQSELIRTWKRGDFRLKLYDTFTTRNGKSILGYEFYHKKVLIFEGADYGCSPCHAVDSDDAVAALLCFLSLRPGDTDREYFDDYTPSQLAFAREYGQELSFVATEMEET